MASFYTWLVLAFFVSGERLPPANWLPQVFKVAGLCETPYPPLLGLTLPQWSLVGFLLVLLALVRSARSRRRDLARL